MSILDEERSDSMAKETLEILTESMFYVLMALLKQPKCGTEIAQFVLEKTKKQEIFFLRFSILYFLLFSLASNHHLIYL